MSEDMVKVPNRKMARNSVISEPRRVDEMYVNESTSFFIQAGDLHLGGLIAFRVFDPQGRVVLHDPCDPTSSTDESSPLAAFKKASIITMLVTEKGDAMDVEFIFDNGYRIQVFDTLLVDAWMLSLGDVYLHD